MLNKNVMPANNLHAVDAKTMNKIYIYIYITRILGNLEIN